MAVPLLFVFVCCFCEIQAQASLPRPTLTVNSLLISEKDSVTLSCSTPTSVSQCSYKLEKEVRVLSCQQTLTGTQLLQMSQQSSPAAVHVGCFYTMKLGDVTSPSPHSDMSSIIVHREKPQLSVEHFPGEHVLFTCSLPESDPGTKCNLYFGEESHPVITTTTWGKSMKTKHLFCQFSVTPADLLRHLRLVQQKVARCDYTLKSGFSSLSPRSDRYSLTAILREESPALAELPTFTMTTGVVVKESPPPPAVTPVKQQPGINNKDIVEKVSQTSTKSSMSTGPTVSTAQPPPVPPPKQPSGSTADMLQSPPVTPSEKTSGEIITGVTVSTNVTQMESASEKRKLVRIVVSVGVSLGVVLLGLALLCKKRRTVAGDSMYMNNLDKGNSNLLPKGRDDFYSVITSAPGADCSAGNEKIEKQLLHKEESVLFNIYSTICEDQPTSALRDMVYSTLQLH